MSFQAPASEKEAKNKLVAQEIIFFEEQRQRKVGTEFVSVPNTYPFTCPEVAINIISRVTTLYNVQG